MGILAARENAITDNGKVEPFIYQITDAAWNVLAAYQHRHADLAVFETDTIRRLRESF
jgi:hypothetical protein